MEGNNLHDKIVFKGRLEVALHNAYTGKEIKRVIRDNTVVTGGRREILEMIHSGGAGTARVFSHLGVGTSTTAPATGDSALGSEATRIAVGTFTTSNLTSNPPSIRFEAQFATNEANTTLGEAALFNSSASGTMLNRATFSTIDKTTSNTLSISYTVSN